MYNLHALLLNVSMEPSLSREANCSIKFPELYGITIQTAQLATCMHPGPNPPRPSLLQLFLMICFTFVLPPTPSPSKWSSSFQFPHQNSVCIFPISRTYHTLRISRRPWCGHSSVLYRTQIIQLFTKESFPFSCYFFPRRPNIIPCTSSINTLGLSFSFDISDQVTHPHKAKVKLHSCKS